MLKRVSQTIYMRWERPHGWLLGKITEKFTSATPRLFAKFNYRIKSGLMGGRTTSSTSTTTTLDRQLPTTPGRCWTRETETL